MSARVLARPKPGFGFEKPGFLPTWDKKPGFQSKARSL
jgi:hypothetical protein